MNWDALAALAELAGAVGVILTLVYLATQIRQNSSFIESSIYQSVTESMLRWQEVIARDREMASLWNKIRDGRTLDESEQERAYGLLMMFFTAIDGHWRHLEKGLVSRATFEAPGLAKLFNSPYMNHWIDRYGSSFLTASCLTKVREVRAQGKSRPANEPDLKTGVV